MSKNFFNIITAFVFCCVFQSIGAAQETGASKPAEWIRVQTNGGEFSVEMPANVVYFYDKDGFNYDTPNSNYQFKEMQALNAMTEKTVMSVNIYKVSSPKKYLNEMIDREKFDGSKTDESKDGLTIKQFEQTKFGKKDGTEISYITRLIATKTHLYVVVAANRGAKTQAFSRFFSSIRLNQPLATDGDVKTVDISSLTPVTIQQITAAEKEDKTAQIPPKAPVADAEKTNNGMIILDRPQAGYTQAARQNGTVGRISLRVTFSKDGRISKIGVLSALPDGLTRSAAFAALRIKFIPLEKDNEFQTVTKTVEYSFDIY